MKEKKAPKFRASILAKYETIRLACKSIGLGYSCVQMIYATARTSQRTYEILESAGFDVSELGYKRAAYKPRAKTLKHDWEADFNNRHSLSDETIDSIAERVTKLKPQDATCERGEYYGHQHSKLEAIRARAWA